MSLFISNQTAGPLSIPDLGITLALGESYDLTQDRAVDIAISKNLPAQILAGNIAVLDPLDDVTPLSPAAGVEATGAMNDAHYRIRGGELNQLDDVDLTTTSPTTNDLLQFDGTDWVPIAFAGTQDLWETITSDAGSVAANSPTDTLTIAGGTGVSTAVSGDTLTITNDSPNVDQNIFETVAGDAGSATANTTTDTITIAGGTGVSTAVSGDTLTITNDSPNVDQNIFQNVSDGTNTAVADTTTDTLTVTAGAGITAVITPASDTLTITNTSPNVDQDIFETVAGDTGSATANTTTDTITFAGGTGISTAVVGDTLTITNDSPNVDQNLFLNVASDSGTAVADNTTDTLTISGGTGISTAVAGDTLTITNDSPNVDQNLWATITADSGSATANTTTDSFDIGGTGNQISTSITADALSIALAPNTQIPGTEGIDIPSGTTAERPTTPTTGVMRFNTDTNLYEAWDGTQWVTFGAPAGSGVKEILFGQLAHLSGTTQTPADNTPPLVTEGSPFFSQEVTTQTDTGRIVIWFSSVATVSNANRTLTIAIYRDSTLVGVTAVSAPGSNAPQTTTFIVVDTPPAAGTYTYTGRIGLSAGGTWYIGGFTTNFNYGGAANTNNQYVLMRIE